MKTKKCRLFLLGVVFFLAATLTWGQKAKAATWVEVGSSVTLTDNNMTNGTGYTKTWASADTSIASTIGNGRNCVVVGRSPGKVRITCYTHSWVTYRYWIQTGPYVSNGYWGTRTNDDFTTHYYEIEVGRGLNNISLSTVSMDLPVDGTGTIKVTPAPSDAVIKTVAFQSSNHNVATVTDSGEVRAVGAGTAVITVTANGKVSAVCQVTVAAKETEGSGGKKPAPNPGKEDDNGNTDGTKTGKLSLNKKSLTLTVGKNIRLTAKLQGKTVLPKFVSSDSKRVTVSKKGLVRAVSCGTVKIRATASNGSTAICTVKVLPPKVDSFGASAKGKTVTLKWKGVKNISGYKIYRSKSAAGKYKLVKTAKPSQKKLMLKNQKRGTYYYKIYSFGRVNGKIYTSSASRAVRVRVK